MKYQLFKLALYLHMFGYSKLLGWFLFISLVFNGDVALFAQCGTLISNYPYSEGFENNNGNFNRSNATHWDWGTIVSKPVITAAANGNKCWIVGGLSGSQYSSGLSFLQTPCFDLSVMNDPEISFSIFWETEKNFDGVNLEYSSDQGQTWFLLGTENSDANCLGTNWYNNSSVRFLGNKPGWSGSVAAGSGGSCQTGNGSGQWLTARHKLTDIAGLTNVMFRFNFGAGTVCNSYDGFALDDFTIQEIPSSNGLINYQCSGNRTVSFSNISQYCQTSIQWDFGDPASGSQNNSTLSNPVHVFSVPGSYMVTQNIRLSNGTNIVTDTLIRILGAEIQATQPLLCSGDQNAVLSAQETTGAFNLNYQWNSPITLQNSVISNLSPGNYTVTITAPGACFASATFQLISPPPLRITTTVSNESCHTGNGLITTTTSGGTGMINYLWSNGATTSNLNGVGAGTYFLTATDANGCVYQTANQIVINQDYPVNVSLGNDMAICPGQSITLIPGSYSSYLWSDLSTNPILTVQTAGLYSVEVSNQYGCKGSDTIRVAVECDEIYFPSSFTPNGDGINDAFGPLGGFNQISAYSMSIYNRWGQRVFYSTDPFKKWNGQLKNKIMNIESYVWICSFSRNGSRTQFRKGTITAVH